jgi:hypothetical protein
MNESLKNNAQQYGFFDPVSKQFFIIPASSEKEFKLFLEQLGALNEVTTQKCSN